MAEPKKQVPLRLNAKLYDALAAWAEDQLDVPPELDIK